MNPRLFHRREIIRSLVGGSLLMPGLVSRLLAESAADDPLSPKAPHFPAKAKRVIFIFSNGGVSHMDTFDHKPKLFAADGKTMGVGGGLSNQQRVLLKPGWQFRPGGKAGTLVSDLFPYLRECMDDVCLIRSMKSDDNEHYNATLGIHCGSFFFSRPSIGSWVSHGLGTLNQNLPSFVVLAAAMPYAGTQIFNNDFLPAYHQGVRVIPGKEPIANLDRRTGLGGVQEMELGLADAFNRRHLQARANDSDLAAQAGAAVEIRERSLRSREGIRRDSRPLRHETRADRRLRLAVSRRAPTCGARRALRRTRRWQFVE
jgi:Protein of unknown function (DUF1501)